MVEADTSNRTSVAICTTSDRDRCVLPVWHVASMAGVYASSTLSMLKFVCWLQVRCTMTTAIFGQAGGTQPTGPDQGRRSGERGHKTGRSLLV